MYMCAWVDGFGRRWRGFGLVFDYIGALANREKREGAGVVQSKSGRLRREMITFDYIEKKMYMTTRGMMRDGDR
jgi:hypothetical protein